MGTRHLITVQLDGQYKIAQYGQWDGYPSGQGVRVLAFLRERNGDFHAFGENLRRLKFATDEQIKAAWVEAGASPDSHMVSMDVAKKLKEKHPELSRDTGSGILDIVLNATAPETLIMHDAISFAMESLFCEFAYVIDFDAGTFEVFKGFNEKPVEHGRFAGDMSNGYGPVVLWRAWQLDALPTEEEFLSALKDGGDDE